jgi:hypothetical protein
LKISELVVLEGWYVWLSRVCIDGVMGDVCLGIGVLCCEKDSR